jgi:L-fucono-1,5-lactonase
VIVDSHQHFWDLAREPMPWMRPAHAVIARTFEPADLRPLLDDCGIDTTILVQAACTDADTDAMFEQADANEWIGAVTAWVDLTSPRRAYERLGRLAPCPKLRGIRHLIHEEDDPHWILREDVLESIALLEDRGLVLELVCVYPRHLGDVPELAQRFPNLTIVIDHLGKPPLLTERMADWRALVQAAAAHGNVAAKISGLNTVLPKRGWTGGDMQDAVEVAVECFGPDRLMWGSDWPYSLLNGDYRKVFRETLEIVTTVAGHDGVRRILQDTPERLYRLGETIIDNHSNSGDHADGRAH